MEHVKKQRKVSRTLFTKNVKDLEKLIDDKADKLDIRVSWELLTEKATKLGALNEEIYTLMLEESSEDELLAELDSCDAYKRKFLVLNVKCADLSEEDTKAQSVGNNSSISTSSEKGKRKFKLPAIEFKTFDGNIKNWLPFWSQFSKVHGDPDIDLNDKVEYLVQATLPGSRARLLVESFPCVGKNYHDIIECLISRFGRDDLQIEVYVRELLKIIVNNALSNGKVDLIELYDSIETQIRALDTLGVKSENCSAMLFPLIESCLPENLLRVWQRSPSSNTSPSSSQQSVNGSSTSRLSNLMQFLRNEVDNEQRILLATESFGLRTSSKHVNAGGHGTVGARRNSIGTSEQVPTATGLVNYEQSSGSNKCIFCDSNHDSPNCFKAQNLSAEKRKEIVTAKRACFRCLRIGHQSRKCRFRLKCIVCGKSHVTLMCSNLPGDKLPKPLDSKKSNQESFEMFTCTNGTTSHVFLQTLRVTIKGANGSRSIRALMDTGSQNTYILMNTAKILGYKSNRQTTIKHSLFGGATTLLNHDSYDVQLSYGNYRCTFEALSQPVICLDVSPVFEGPWKEELNKLNIELADWYDAAPIELLIGSDVAGKLYTGRRHILKCGLVAIETLLGWTLMGRIPIDRTHSETITAISLFINDASLTQLWQLDTLGIKDPTEQKSSDQLAQAAAEFFLETVARKEDGRYEVRLPWVEGHPPLPTNYNIAKKRLSCTLNKLENIDLLDSYSQVFNEWEGENIIEDVSTKLCVSDHIAHYLPHRPVVKESSTTRIRPVFDASAKERGSPSLNQCLEKGVNLIELIPNILLGFRKNKIGVVADIRKAFLQISIHKADRDFLRFLWVDSSGNEKVYRHMRVVFGLSSSPFLLAATLKYHLANALEKCETENVPYCKENLSRLSNSFYVDNCVASVPDDVTLKSFIQDSRMVMDDAKFDLRGWEFSYQPKPSDSPQNTGLLGMVWCTETDMLGINKDCLKDFDKLLSEPVTKRKMLSLAQKIFDPVGFTSPTTLIPKLLLQKIWQMKLSWDTNVDQETENIFRKWLKDLPYLLDIKIPRWIHAGPNEAQHLSLHTFADASQTSYAAVVFLRWVCDGQVFVQLVAAKSRVAPIHELTINRLELMAALISTRLYLSVKEYLKLDVDCFFWTDSSTVFFWITKSEAWGTFVYNRVAEIRQHTSVKMWRHVPGSLNPADLPSRGCSAKKLLESRWWEGPSWLYENSDLWPQGAISYNEEEISIEKKKKLVTTLSNARS